MAVFQKELKELRAILPVGLREGLSLLEKSKGDVSHAAEEFRRQRVVFVAKTANVTEFEAREYLEINKYEIEPTLRRIEEEQFTFTERILKSRKKTATKLSILTGSIEAETNLERDFWLKEEEFSKLNPHQYTVIQISEWLNYCSWEGVDQGIELPILEKVIELIEEKLDEQEFARNLRNIRNRKRFLWKSWNRKELLRTDFDKFLEISNSINQDAEYDQLISQFNESISQLEEALLHGPM